MSRSSRGRRGGARAAIAAIAAAVVVVALAGTLDATAARAQEPRPDRDGGLVPAPERGGGLVPAPATPGASGPAGGGSGASTPETPEVKALREALTGEPATEARARKLATMGADDWALLLATPSLAALADEVVEPALAAATDERLAEVGRRLSRNRPSLIGRLARRMTSGPRPPLVAAFVAPAEGAAEDTELDGPSAIGRLLAESAVRYGTVPFEMLLHGPQPVTGAARQTLAAALGASGRDDAIDALTRLLSEEVDVALTAVQALGQCPDGKGAAIPALVRSLTAADPLVRRAAAQSLGRLRAAEAVDALLSVLADPDADRPRRRAPGAEGTGGAGADGGPDGGRHAGGAGADGTGGAAPATGGPAGGGATGGAEEEADPATPLPLPPGAIRLTAQVEAARALREIACDPHLPDDAAAVKRQIAAMRAAADKRLPLLLTEVDSGDPQAAIGAARELPKYAIRRDRIRPVLLRMLGASDPPTRALGASTLGALREPLAIPALIDALDDPDPDVWEAALAALRGITGKDLPAKPELWRRRNVRR